MASRTPSLPLVVLAALVLSGCSAAGAADEASPTTGGTIELAISETCTETSDPQCVSVNGQSVVLPAAFESAGVEDAAVVSGEGQNAIDVTFSTDGAEVLKALTEEAVQAGEGARLVVKIGGELRAAVTVMHALDGDQVQLVLSPDESAEEVLDLIHGG